MSIDKLIDAVLWQNIKNFRPLEFGKTYHKVQMDLIILLDRFRDRLGVPVVIHCAYATTGHSKNSQHAKGCAADLHCVGVSLLNAFTVAEEIGFKGIGVYPHWEHPGLHLDIRDGKSIRWVQNEDGEYEYLDSKEIIERLERL